MNRLLRRLRREDSGLTLVELMVASMITLLLMTMIGSMFIQVTRITTDSNETQIYNGLASNAANELSAVIRVATTLPVDEVTQDPAIFDGTRSTLTLFTLSNTESNTDPTNPEPVRVTFELDELKQQVTEERCYGMPDGDYWTFTTCRSTSSRVFGKGILAPTGVDDQLFTYLDANGDPILIGSGSLSESQRALVASIQVIVRVKTVAESDTGVVLVKNEIVLRNLGLDSGLDS